MSNSKPIKRSSTIFPYRGKWRIQYFDQTGKIRTKTVGSRQEAYRDLVILEQLVADGRLPKRAQESPTLEDWLSDWLEMRKSEVRPVTHWGFESTIRQHIVPALGHLRLPNVSLSVVERLYRDLETEKKLSAATVRKVHALLNHSLAMAVRHGFLDENPVRFAKTPSVHKSRIEVLSGVEIARMLVEASKSGPLSELRWLLALRYGLRQGECLALKWGDFNLATQTLAISRTVNSIPGQGFVVTAPKSSKSIRDIPLDDETFSIIQCMYLGNPSPELDSLVFPSRSGSYMDARTDYDRWQKLLKDSGLPPLKLHAARHSAATLLLSSGANIREIQLILGHASPSFTMATYLHPGQAELRSAIEGVCRLIRKS